MLLKDYGETNVFFGSVGDEQAFLASLLRGPQHLSLSPRMFLSNLASRVPPLEGPALLYSLNSVETGTGGIGNMN